MSRESKSIDTESWWLPRVRVLNQKWGGFSLLAMRKGPYLELVGNKTESPEPQLSLK